MGLGHVFISERFNIKEAATLSGAAGAVSASGSASRPRRPTTTRATRSSPRRTPATMHRLTGGRFTLGLGRGITPLFDAFGIPTHHHRADRGLRRARCGGCGAARSIFGHDGPAGSCPVLHLDADVRRRHPARHRRVRPQHRSRSPAARSTQVVLHTFFTDETTARCVATREAGGGGGGPRPVARARLVVLRDRRRPPARRPAAQEDGRAARDLPPGLRRPARADQRLGPGGARALPRRRASCASFRGGVRRDGHHRGARARRDADPRRVAGADGRRVTRAVRGRGAAASSTSGATA